MSGENQYISPIIDAFLRRRQQDLQTQQEGVANQQRQDSIDNENKYRESLIKESQARLDEAHRKAVADEALKQQLHENQSLATKDTIHQKIAEAVRNAPEGPGEADKAAVNMMRSLGGQGVQAGENPLQVGGQTLPGSPTTQLTMPGGKQSFGIEGMPTGSQAAFAAARAAAEKAGQVSDATIDNKLLQDSNKATTRHQGDVELTQMKIDATAENLAANNVSKENVAKWRDDAMLKADYAHNQTTLKAAQLHMGAGFDGDTAGNLAERGHHLGMEILNGNGDYTKLPLADKYAVDAWGQANDIAIPKTAAYRQTLNAMDSLPALYNQIKDVAHRYSVDSAPIPANPKTGELGSPGGSKWDAAVHGNVLANLAGQGVQMDSAIKNITKAAGTLSLAEEPQARQTGQIIGSQTLAAFNPNLSEAENMRNIDNAMAKNSDKLDHDVFVGIPKPIADTVKLNKGLVNLEPPAGKPTVPPRASNNPIPPKPGAVLNPVLTKTAGKNIWDLPPQPPVASQGSNAVPVAPAGLPNQGAQ